MHLLRTNTATRVTVGPFLDKTDGVTPETALTVTACHLTFVVDDSGVPTLILDTSPTASGGNNDMVHITGDDAGYYDLELTAANVNYLGRAKLALTDAANHCPVFSEFMILPAVVYDALVLGTDLLDVSVLQWLGTAAATPATAGVPDVNAKNINNATAPTLTGDSYARLGAPAGASVSADIAAVKTDTVNSLANEGTISGQISSLNDLSEADIRAALGMGSADLDAQIATLVTAAKLLKYVQLILRKDSAIATDNSAEVTEINANGGSGAGGFANTTDAQEALRDRGDAAWTTATGFSTLDATGVRTAVGLGSANLDTQLGTIAGYIDTEVAAIKLQTDLIPGNPASVSDIPTVSEIADQVWDEILSDHVVSGSTGEALGAAGGAGDPWITVLPGSYGAGQAGYILGTNIDAAVSSRLSSAGYTVPPTAVQNRAEMDANSTKLANLDATVSSRLATSGYTAPDNADIALIKAKTNLIPANPAAVSDIPTAIENADALLKRDWTLVTGEAARSVLNALRFLRNKWVIIAGILHVKKEDDSTDAFTAAVSTDAAAEPITGSDPS